MSINLAQAWTRPYRVQQLLGVDIRSSWLVEIIHPDLSCETFLADREGYIEFHDMESALAYGKTWERKQKAKGATE